MPPFTPRILFRTAPTGLPAPRGFCTRLTWSDLKPRHRRGIVPDGLVGLNLGGAESGERVVIPAPSACACCGGKLSKLGEDITETLEVVPRQWKVIQTVRAKFSCRSCEAINQPPAPFCPIARVRPAPAIEPLERDRRP